jgi:hypothetical protein
MLAGGLSIGVCVHPGLGEPETPVLLLQISATADGAGAYPNSEGKSKNWVNELIGRPLNCRSQGLDMSNICGAKRRITDNMRRIFPV